MAQRAQLHVGDALITFAEQELLPELSIGTDEFWAALQTLVDEFSERNLELLEERQRLQSLIDAWHRDHGQGTPGSYRAFLESIGYLVPQGPSFTVSTDGVDPEIASIAGPQLVVPVTNARYAINAVNARWGSLYDALYGTDVLGDLPPAGPYSEERGPGSSLMHASCSTTAYHRIRQPPWLARLPPRATPSSSPTKTGTKSTQPPLLSAGPAAPKHLPASWWPTTSCTCTSSSTESIPSERPTPRASPMCDSNRPSPSSWIAKTPSHALMQEIRRLPIGIGLAFNARLSPKRSQKTAQPLRRMADDLQLTSHEGTTTLSGTSLMLVRNVGHLMTTPAVQDSAHNDIPEGILDALFTIAAALPTDGSAPSSIYIVKPKMHGPTEVEFACDLFGRVEQLLGLAPNTVKIGIMDEERRTTLNLAECIRVAASRVAFINTGFLDRTGDEIHTSMLAGPMIRKADMKAQQWISAYEDNNVDVGITCGLVGSAQIGKGMWAAPDLMADMLETKINHPLAGASSRGCRHQQPQRCTQFTTTELMSPNSRAVLRMTPPRPSRLEELLSIPVENDPHGQMTKFRPNSTTTPKEFLAMSSDGLTRGSAAQRFPTSMTSASWKTERPAGSRHSTWPTGLLTALSTNLA